MQKSYQEQNVIERLLALLLGAGEAQGEKGGVTEEELLPLLVNTVPDPLYEGPTYSDRVRASQQSKPYNRNTVPPVQAANPYRGGGLGEVLSYILGGGGEPIKNRVKIRSGGDQ